MASDYYTKNYLSPSGENAKFLYAGGFSRAAPAVRVPLSGSDWKFQNLKKEIARATAIGIDGFSFDIMSSDTNSDNLSAAISMAAAAAAVNPKFTIVPMLDMTAEFATQPANVSKVIRLFNTMPSAYRTADGSLVVAPFSAENQTPTWWKATLDALRAEGIKIAFMPVFLNSLVNGPAYASVSAGYGDWGARTPDTVVGAAYKLFPTTAHLLGKTYMMPVAPQDWRPKDLLYWEAGNSRTFRLFWDNAISGGADSVQLVTWNDYSENAQFAPSMTADGELQRGFYDMSSYYINWFKNGAAPEITSDVLYYVHRKHSTTVNPSSSTYQTGLMSVIGNAAPTNQVELVAFLKAAGTLEITVGGKTSTMSAPAGITSFSVPLAAGRPTFRLLRNSNAVISFASQTEIVSSITRSDLTYQSGSAGVNGTCFTLDDATN